MNNNKTKVEKTGIVYKCNKCGYKFDWEDDACPNCGSRILIYFIRK